MRHATETDLPAIVDIYNASIPSRLATADLEPVSIESKRAWFNSHSPDDYPLLVHEIDGCVVAWVGFQPFYKRPAHRHTAEISFYISPPHQGKGLGKSLVREAEQVAASAGTIRTLIAYVYAHNIPSIALLTRCGFTEWGLLPDVSEMDGKEYSVTVLGKRIVS